MSRRTPLYEAHRRLGARMVDFAGWEMPVGYGDPVREHMSVRSACGLFDVSHMGELRFEGPDAGRVCQRLTTNDIRRLADGEAQYTLACRENGGVLDDLILYRLGSGEFFAIVNAAHTEEMYRWCATNAEGDVRVRNESDRWALLALQGPRALEALLKVAPIETGQRAFTMAPVMWEGATLWVSRTGYTGEDGFEILVPAELAAGVWDRVLEEVLNVGGSPAGLAARDTLRLEAGLPLCGSDMDEATTPLEVGLGWAVRFVGGNDFIGRPALERVARQGVSRRLVCFEILGAGVPRHGYQVRIDGESIGTVTSGAKSPTLGRFIGLALVQSAHAEPGTKLEIVIRGRAVPAQVVTRPFYRRNKRGQ